MSEKCKQAVLDRIAVEMTKAEVPGAPPKYARLAEVIYSCVRDGQLEPGDALPSETELCDVLPVGLSTVQKALTQLADQGIVVRRRKLGTFIADFRNQVPEVHVYRFRDPVTGKLMLPFTRALSVEDVHPEELGALAAGFGDDPLVRLDRLVWTEGDRPVFSSIFLRKEHAKGLSEQSGLNNFDGVSVHRHLAEKFNLPTFSVTHRVSAEELSASACANMDLAPPHVGLIWEATDRSFNDKQILVQRFELPRGHRPMEIVEGKRS
ncbi:GntR family transcriptional regulator [Thalassospira sp. MA62]|nr:GntR family transcriptional regulator [Thalassospira sp. MA62]